MKPKEWLVCLAVCVLILLPHICAKSRHGIVIFGAPRLMGGDEPFYMLMISSLIEDGDLDLRNNYTAQLAGSWQAGENYAGRGLGHHSVWFEGSRRRCWEDYYDPEKWIAIGNQLNPVPLVQGVVPQPNQADYPSHPPGMAFAIMPVLLVIEPILSLFGMENELESVSILCSGFEIILAAYFFWKLTRRYVTAPWLAGTVTILAFLGTPAWHYGRSLFSEPLLVLCATASYSIVLRRKGSILPGVFIGIGILSKPPFLLLGIPLGVCMLLDKNYRGIIRFSFPIIISGIGLLWLNDVMFGSPFRGSLSWYPGSLVKGISGLMLSPDHGMISFTPVALFALAGWLGFWREYRSDAQIILAGFGCYFLLMSSWFFWWGGYCYGPRMIMPVIPLFLIPLARGFEYCTSWWSKSLFWTLASLSVIINFYGAVPYWNYWGQNPLFVFLSSFFSCFNFPIRP